MFSYISYYGDKTHSMGEHKRSDAKPIDSRWGGNLRFYLLVFVCEAKNKHVI